MSRAEVGVREADAEDQDESSLLDRLRLGAIAEVLPPLVVVLAGVGVWYGLIAVLGLKDFVLPAPHQAVQTLFLKADVLWRHSLYTLWEAVGGFLQVGDGA